MTFLLSTQNVVEYLIERKLCCREETKEVQIESKSSKNFNLLVSLNSDRHFLVKQEPCDRTGQHDGAFLKEWQIHKWLEKNSKSSPIRPIIVEAIDFEPKHSIIVFEYLHDYCDLELFYREKQLFSNEIAASIGAILADIHRITFNCQESQKFLFANRLNEIERQKYAIRGMNNIRPEVFGHIGQENFIFFKLYQRYKSLGEAIAQLQKAYQCCCLIHNDLKLDNILLNKNNSSNIRIIDWELFKWGDPGFDLGKILADYLRLWLKSLMINTDIELNTALRLATTPLELLQPSMAELIKAYCDRFPEILVLRPDFIQRVVQFTGFALLRGIWTRIFYHESFDNNQIAILQVAKTLLCNPQQSISTLFGTFLTEVGV
jgi:tRNA A-37 threonylcarbamoyl transferase component Bud32